MSKLYDDLINIIDFQPDKDVEARVEKYCKRLQEVGYIKFFVDIILVSFALFSILDEFIWGFVGSILILIFSIIFYKWYIRSCSVRFGRKVNAGCNFNRILTAYMVLTRYTQKPKDAEIWIPSIGNCLLCLGEFDEAKKVLDLVEKYCNTPVGKAYRITHYAVIARFEMDKEAVEQYTKELDIIMPQINKPDIIKSYNNILKYPRNMELEEKGDYARALEVFEQNENDTILQKVNLNYRLYKIAKTAGLEEEASKHGAFVLEHGGDTFFKRELEGSLNE